MALPTDGENEPKIVNKADADVEKPKPQLVIVKSPPEDRKEKWVGELERSGKTGPFHKILMNALIAFRKAAEWRDVLRYDELALKVEAALPPPWEARKGAKASTWKPRPWSDQDDNLATEWLQRQKVFVGAPIVAAAIQTVAREHAFHPVREYLGKLEWDGQERLKTWLADYMGADAGEYQAAVGARWLIAGVARVMRPGTKVDSMLIFEGLQDQGKSTVLRRLAEPWFSDELKDLRNKDTAMSIAGKWIVEFQELEALKGATVENLKAFLSRNEDRFRPPYGRNVVDSPRQCIFGGTTNQTAYLQDETGNRRFWPIECRGKVRPDELGNARDQLWAEARHRYQQQEHWWLDTPELKMLAAEEQDRRLERDPWESAVRSYVQSKERVTTTELLEEIAEISIAQATKGHQMRMGKVLDYIGWTPIQIRQPDGSKPRFFVPKSSRGPL